MGIAIRAALLYILLTLVLRMTTRRVLRTATPIDMVVIFIFGGLVVQAILGPDNSVTSALIALFTISLMHVLMSVLMPRWRLLGMVVQGTPVTLFGGGEFRHDSLHRLRVQEADVLSEVRQKGLRSLDDVDMVMLEQNGGFSVIPKAGR